MNLRDSLRSKTKDTHQELDDFVGEMRVFDSVTKYRVFLLGMNRLYQVFGSELDWASEQIGVPPSTAKLVSSIQSDGSFTSNELKWNDENSRQQLSHYGLSDDEACKWGAAYVLEGSAMGARYMVKAAEKLIESQSSEAADSISATYLQTLANESYERWPKFVEELNAADCDTSVAVQSAEQVFVAAKKIFVDLAQK